MSTTLAPASYPVPTGSSRPSLHRGLHDVRCPRSHLNPLVRLGQWTDDLVFRRNHRHRLVYNACWEDPALDRALLRLDASSRVVMITSAGCNALDYLLDSPAEIHAVDVNPRQNALLQLKLALLRAGSFEDLFQAFGEGRHPEFPEVLRSLLDRLPPDTAEYWLAKSHYLDGRHFKRSFYFHGSCGDVAWVFRTLVLRRCPGMWRDLIRLLEADSLESQREAFGRIEPKLWNVFTRWLMRRPATLSLLGVPRSQSGLIARQWPGGVLGYLQDKLRRVATELPMGDNYFWRVYVNGSYSLQCCPNYLKREHFAHLRRLERRIRTHTCLLGSFLRDNPGRYSHYVLLDHQDWLAGHDREALADEWRLILENSRPGTRILFRSAAPQVDFLPEFVIDRVRFNPELTSALHTRDRVGTYGSLHLGEVL
ncbi:MAG: BtaA family protein [Verrucomicrobiales bacterium]|nr:BtaA family protein [Verrucomicrobiales bacterium]